jgi:hypothetical protein
MLFLVGEDFVEQVTANVIANAIGIMDRITQLRDGVIL